MYHHTEKSGFPREIEAPAEISILDTYREVCREVHPINSIAGRQKLSESIKNQLYEKIRQAFGIDMGIIDAVLVALAVLHILIAEGVFLFRSFDCFALHRCRYLIDDRLPLTAAFPSIYLEIGVRTRYRERPGWNRPLQLYRLRYGAIGC